jgi:chemotaxis signal transduction protein
MITTSRPNSSDITARIRVSQAQIGEAVLAADQNRLDEVYRERARQLAIRSTSTAESTETWLALVFTIGVERLCLPLADLVEILPGARCSPLLGGHEEIAGLLNARGRICTVLDLARVLKSPVPDHRPLGFVVLVRHCNVEIGLRVDDVHKIETVSSKTLTEISDHANGGRRRWRTPGQASVLNIAELLSNPNLQCMER